MEFQSHAQYLWWKALPYAERKKLSDAASEQKRAKGGPSDRRVKEREQRLENVAVFDVETPKFDNENPDKKILPFLGVIYADSFPPIIIWEEDYPTFVSAVLAAFDTLPGKWTIYAHNGGRFDWMFFLAYIRGKVVFKGRGLMSAMLGRHELRDSWHILPTKLAAFQKDEFNYDWMEANQREKHRSEIIDYCINDCRYLLRTVKAFLRKYGFVLTIGQAAMQQIKAVYNYDRCNERLDSDFRRFYFGGRVECLQGAGLFRGPYKLYDLNSAYPDAMANYHHPHKLESIAWRYGEPPSPDTYFIKLRCRNKNALISPPDYRLTGKKIQAIADSIHPGTELKEGEFFTTIWEHDTALRCGLIQDIEYLECIDFEETTDFSEFILPNYEQREPCKALIADYENRMTKLEAYGHEEYQIAVRDSLFYKLINNNGYGKFAQNPRGFKDKQIRDIGDCPEDYKQWERGEIEECNWVTETYEHETNPELNFTIWERPADEFRFNNVAIAASITGRVRATLMEAIHNADDAIYCDTDSILCRELNGVALSSSKLGAWNFEGEFNEVIIAGKKTYMARNTSQDIKPGKYGPIKPKTKNAAKGGFGLKWQAYHDMIGGKVVASKAKGVTLYKNGAQEYLVKNLRQTAPKRRVSDAADYPSN